MRIVRTFEPFLRTGMEGAFSGADGVTPKVGYGDYSVRPFNVRVTYHAYHAPFPSAGNESPDRASEPKNFSRRKLSAHSAHI